MELTDRQKQIIEIVKKQQPISGEKIAFILGFARATLRPDFSLLTMSGILLAKPKVGYLINEEHTNSVLVEQIAKQKVEKVMAISVNLTKETSIQDAIIQLFLEDCGSLYVTDNREILGIVSRKDLLKSALGDSDLNAIPVGMVMTKMPNLYTVFSDTFVVDATKLLVTHRVDSLPVLSRSVYEETGKKEVIGKFSKSTASRLLLDIFNKDL
ncbi:CBS domain protein [Trichococcus patagoniensis]|uniref:CBS domain protein n=1 Tax=Trichococcus patagoniensis TaxID=382641 RepID=A0A2T5IMZ3_9LACT|nr:CBS domain-containing protein [Trichococcus patagoniensis]PTQ85194.1 CBS domain protein [Trichococcus patagoniensis]